MTVLFQKCQPSVCICLCVWSVLLPWLPRWRRVPDHATDDETSLKVSIVLNSEALALLVTIDQWTEVDVTCRCDLVPKGPHSKSLFVKMCFGWISESPPINKLMKLSDCDGMWSTVQKHEMVHKQRKMIIPQILKIKFSEGYNTHGIDCNIVS